MSYVKIIGSADAIGCFLQIFFLLLLSGPLYYIKGVSDNTYRLQAGKGVDRRRRIA